MHKILKLNNFKNLKIMITAALFAAISIICGKFLAINLGDTIRLSIENLPIILSGILFGPTVAAFTGLIADVVGCILRGYAINPILTAAAVFIGFSSGLIYGFTKNWNINLRIAIILLFCHTIGSVLIKTVGLCIWFNYPFFITLIGRILNYIIVASIEFIALKVLLKNKSFIKIIGEKNEL